MEKFAYTHANVYMEGKSLASGYVLVEGEKITGVGSMESFKGDRLFKQVDLEGATILPGFIDTHVHLTWTASELFYPNFADAVDLADILARVKALALQSPTGTLLQGVSLNYSRLSEKRYPNIEELTQVAPDHAVVITDQTGHAAVVNRSGLAYLVNRGLDIKDLFDDGLITRGANYQARDILAREAAASGNLEKAWLEACRIAAAKGIVTLHALEGSLDAKQMPAAGEIKRMVELAQKMPIDILVYYQTLDVDSVVKAGLPRIGGCVLVDGAFSPHTAALKEPYVDEPGTCGCLYYDHRELLEYVRCAHENGLQVALHACGDAAIEEVLGIYETVLVENPRKNHRFRIEHFEVPEVNQIYRAAGLGICLGMQPAFDHYWDLSYYATKLGPGRAARKNALKSILESGIVVGGGSDSGVTPMDPLLGIHTAVNSTNEAERISPMAAVKMFTYGGAYLGFQEEIRGLIKVGLRADLVFLEEDPTGVDTDRIKDITVLATMFGGKFIFHDPGFPAF